MKNSYLTYNICKLCNRYTLGIWNLILDISFYDSSINEDFTG
ncbi:MULTISPECIES: hypothetical protein [unclassified Clostridium]|nr:MULTISPECIES: hypothetical protein [unclassified Clostridium]